VRIPICSFVATMLLLQSPIDAQAQTAQQLYDQAEAAYTKGDVGIALDIFSGLVQKLGSRSSVNTGKLRARYGTMLLADNQPLLAATLLQQAVIDLEPTDDNHLETTASALRSLADALLETFQYKDAAVAYAQAERRMQPFFAKMPPLEKFHFHEDFATALFWSGAGGAEVQLDKASEALIQIETPKNQKASHPKDSQAYFLAMKARFALTKGDKQAASKMVRSALQLAGGLSERTSLLDRSVRQDAALVAWSSGNTDDVYKYTYASGSGLLGYNQKNLSSDAMRSSFTGAMPRCDSESGIGKEDTVVVEFALSKAGLPIYVRPIYSSAGTSAIVPFLKIVQDWRIKGEIDKLDQFWRSNYRVSMRCQLAADNRPSALVVPASAQRLITAALSRAGLVELPPEEQRKPSGLRQLQAAILRREAENAPLEEIAPLYFLMENAVRLDPQAMARAAFDKAIDEKSSLLPLLLYRAGTKTHDITELRALMARAERLKQRDVLYWLRAVSALNLERNKNRSEARTLYEKLAAEDISPNSPYRLLALLHLAAMAKKKDPAKADAFFKATSLSAEQCALFDVNPIVKSMRRATNFKQFNGAYVRGWVHIEMDIDAEGKSQNVRTVAAYPPFMLEKYAFELSSSLRFEPIFRGNGEGCKGYSVPIVLDFLQNGRYN
jgi:hypothetical protein